MKTLRLRPFTVAFILLLALLVAACGSRVQSDDPGAAADATDSGEVYKVHFAVYWTGHPWVSALVEHLKFHLEAHPNVDLTVSDAQNRKDKLISDMEDAISRRVDMIIVNSSDADSPRDVAARAEKEGIRVVGLQKLINGDDYTAAIVGDEADIGRLQVVSAAQALEEKYGEPKGKLAILNGIPGASNTVERQQGWDEMLADYPGIQVVADQPAHFRRDDGLKITENWIQGRIEIDAIIAAVDESAIGAALAYADAGRAGEVAIVGGNAQMEALEMVMSGDMHSSIWIPDTVEEGITIIMDILEGKDVPFLNKIPGIMIDASTVNDVYQEHCYVYRGPEHAKNPMPDGC